MEENSSVRNAGILLKSTNKEQLIDIAFNIFKFNNRPKPSAKNTLIFPCFSEFGCEVLSCLYAIPKILNTNPGYYTIAIGWYGREYFYRHLVDEFWELKEEFQFLREYALALHNSSKTLKKFEEKVAEHGKVVKDNIFGNIFTCNRCNKCNYYWADINKNILCLNCLSSDITPSLLGNEHYWRSKAYPIPQPSKSKISWAKSIIKPNSVAIFARNRKRYNRNLPPKFYIKLINILKDYDYNPIWMGERATSLECPDNIPNFLGLRDLETVLALMSQVQFSIQFWTASTRLAGLVNVPYLLFESPEQILGPIGQEGKRLKLICDKGKIVFYNYDNFIKDMDKGLIYVGKALEEIKQNNWKHMPAECQTQEVLKYIKKC